MFTKISESITNNEKKHCFFIPIVEQIKASNYNNEHIWSFAKQPNRARKFYCAAALLQQLESPRLAPNKVLSCYKVMLTESERQQLKALEDNNSLFIGVFNFMPSDIESLIVFDNHQQLEYTNPFFYQQERSENQVTCKV